MKTEQLVQALLHRYVALDENRSRTAAEQIDLDLILLALDGAYARHEAEWEAMRELLRELADS